MKLKFADDFKDYLKEFGAISAKGVELTGIAPSERLNVVSATKSERKIYDIPADLYVVENVAIDGIVVLQNNLGEIYEMSPGSKLNTD